MPEQKSCTRCSDDFQISKDDLAFYDQVSPVFEGKKYQVPSPTLCPTCRQQRRMAWRNMRSLYQRSCDLCHTQMLSIYSSDKPYTVYCRGCYYSDKWDALDYGREFDFGPITDPLKGKATKVTNAKPFFEQFEALLQDVPMVTLDIKEDNENCDFTNYVSGNKNCYLIFAASFNEDSYYSTYLQRCRNVVDSFFIFDSELCYECVDCYSSYGLSYCQDCNNCSDSFLLFDCRGCRNCFGCVSLSNKEYHIFNKPYSREDYFKKVAELTASRASIEKAQLQFEELKKTYPHKYYSGINNESVTGDHISYSKNSHDCFDCTYLEDCRYCIWLHKAKTSYDCHGWGLTGELGYENHLAGNNFYNVRFSESCWDNVSDLMYCRYCLYNCDHLFGCVGLQRKQYCVLNKEYSKEDYEKLVERIIEHMKKTNEWGEFFPVGSSPFGYNETEGIEYLPLTREEAIKQGFKWKEKESQVTSFDTYEIPEKIEDVTDEIIGKYLSCQICEGPYKIIAQELQFYRDRNLPIPRECHECRYKRRVDQRNPRRLWERTCDKCGVKIKNSYSPERPEKVYCEKCYLKEVY